MSLPARYYIDPDYYRSELEWFFFEMWIHAGRADEIPEPGDFLVREIAGESVIVVRREGGGLSAYYNVCRHRGTRLTEEKSGRFASTIQCPYHAWTYDLKGLSARGPADGPGPRLPPGGLSAPPGRRRPLGRAHFSEPERKPRPLCRQLGGLDERFRPWGMDQLRSGHRIVYDVAANWKLIIHNYSECLHCPGVHPALQKLSHYLSGENEPAEPGFLGGRMRLRDGIGTLSFDGRLRRACLPGLTPMNAAMFTSMRRCPTCS